MQQPCRRINLNSNIADSTRVKIITKNARHTRKHGKLILDDGTVFEGEGFGRSAVTFGEIVFNTGMVGYTEALTDPSYNGQILTLTYPLVGNYGVPDPAITDGDGIPKFFESDRIQARGLAVHKLSEVASHWNMHMTLDEWLYNEGIPGISGIDTRALTKMLRSGGVMMASLVVSDDEIDTDSVREQLASATPYTSEQFMDVVSTDKPRAYGYDMGIGNRSGHPNPYSALDAAGQPDFAGNPGPAGTPPGSSRTSRGNPDFDDPPIPPKTDPPIVVIDTGAKHAILRNVRSLGYGAILVPWDTTYEKIMSYGPAGVVLSSGPGDPENCPQTIKTARNLIQNNIPTLGICLGAQILGLAGNASTYKLKYGHRGQNKPCTDVKTGRTFVTSQNHGYGISPDSLPGSDFDLWFKNADDGTVEGIRHKSSPCIAVQFHPEAAPGPFDCRFIFEDLKRLIVETGNNRNSAKNDTAAINTGNRSNIYTDTCPAEKRRGGGR